MQKVWEKNINLVITSKSIPNSDSSKPSLMYFLHMHAHTSYQKSGIALLDKTTSLNYQDGVFGLRMGKM